MRLCSPLILAALLPSEAPGQAPASAYLWDLPAATLAVPPALETGATAAFWNPAAALADGSRIGAQAIQTPGDLGLSGVLAGVAHRLGTRLGVSLIFGRVEIGDLVRTTSSPTSQEGDIPVYEQLGGLALGARVGALRLAGSIRGHDARFDVFREAGLTADLGVRAGPIRGITLGAATRFVPVTFVPDPTARYYGGIEYASPELSLWGAPAQGSVRYGVVARRSGAPEHTVGAGVALASRLRLDAAYARERAFGGVAWRLSVAVGIRAGRYDILAARGSGVGGLGANYRVGLDVGFQP
ncbi:MAG: hypothetical protein HY560_09415 [Gemmatimonadetes bacterium]|nr:hypothetical protein [Gemmatimonadota bacterium]